MVKKIKGGVGKKFSLSSKNILIILAIMALGLLIVNQTLSYMYKSQLLQQPCDLCMNLNPQFKSCMIEKLKQNDNLTIRYDYFNVSSVVPS